MTWSARVHPPARTTAATRSSATATPLRRATPTNVKTSIAGNDVTLTWNASTDNSTDPIQYEILKDDPTFGTIVVGTTFDRTFTDTERDRHRRATSCGPSTPPATARRPPPSSRSPRRRPRRGHADLRRRHVVVPRRTARTSAPPGASRASTPRRGRPAPSQLGWGVKGETTTIPSGPITDYFVKHVNIPSPSHLSTVTVRLKRDDGAVVYVNGVEVGARRTCPPAAHREHPGERRSRRATPRRTWNEYQVPASLFSATVTTRSRSSSTRRRSTTPTGSSTSSSSPARATETSRADHAGTLGLERRLQRRAP